MPLAWSQCSSWLRSMRDQPGDGMVVTTYIRTSKFEEMINLALKCQSRLYTCVHIVPSDLSRSGRDVTCSMHLARPSQSSPESCDIARCAQNSHIERVWPGENTRRMVASLERREACRNGRARSQILRASRGRQGLFGCHQSIRWSGSYSKPSASHVDIVTGRVQRS